MECLIYPTAEELSRHAATRVALTVRTIPDAVLALPTGNTPLGMYREMRGQAAAGNLDLSRARLFALDEFWPLPAGHGGTFAAFLRRNLIDHVRVGAFDHLHSDAPDPVAECDRYAAAIAAAGGIDLAVLGIGRNGHIGYNEPGVAPTRDCLCVDLEEGTRKAAREYFPGFEPPSRGLTMGLRLILSARSVMLMASGTDKAAIIAQAFGGPVTLDVPASLLQQHPDVTIMQDVAAAAEYPCTGR